MKKFFIVASGLIFLLFSDILAQDLPSKTNNENIIIPSGWRIIVKGKDKGLIIPGLHAELRPFKFSEIEFNKWVNEVDNIFIEYNIFDDQSTYEFVKEITKLPEIEHRISEAQKININAKLEGFGYDKEVVKNSGKLSFFVLSTILESRACVRSANVAMGFEARLVRAAKSAGKSIGNLESIEIITAALNSIKDEVWIGKIDRLVDYDFIRQCPQQWRKSNAEMFQLLQRKLYTNICQQQREAYKALWGETSIYDQFVNADSRNKEFARRIAAQVETEGRSLFMIGAGHFGCSNDVRELLKALNKDIEFVPLDE
jgi:uncharacterized protein YbaP (TraB family)